MLAELEGYDPDDDRPAFGPGCLVGLLVIATPWLITAVLVLWGTWK